MIAHNQMIRQRQANAFIRPESTHYSIHKKVQRKLESLWKIQSQWKKVFRAKRRVWRFGEPLFQPRTSWFGQNRALYGRPLCDFLRIIQRLRHSSAIVLQETNQTNIVCLVLGDQRNALHSALIPNRPMYLDHIG